VPAAAGPDETRSFTVHRRGRLRCRRARAFHKKSLQDKELAKFRLAGAGADAHYPRMFPSRPRKLAAWARCAVLVCAPALTSLAHADPAAPTDIRVRLVSPVASAMTSVQAQVIGISGKAPARCAPTVGQVTLDGNNLNIGLQPATTACAKGTAAFSLRVDPNAGSGLSALPGQVYRIRVYSLGDGAPQLLAFSLLDLGGATAAAQPENGFWWSEASSETGPAAPGNGASIEVQGDQLAVGLFGFADSGAATWTFGSASLQGRVARAPLVQLADGDSSFTATATQPNALPGPRLELEFLSPSRARAYLVRSEAGRDMDVRTLMLSRSRFATGPVGSAWSGQWVLLPDDESAPRLFDFASASSHDAETFHLADVGHDAALDCRLAAGTQQPEMCTLSAATETLADFDQVGVDHLSGRGSDGGRVRLMRVPR
jgi:hypothetical protein